MKCRVQWTSAGHHHSHVLQNCSWNLTDLTLRFWAAVLFKNLSDSPRPYGKKISRRKIATSKATRDIHWNKACKMKYQAYWTLSLICWYISWDREGGSWQGSLVITVQSSSWSTADKEQEAIGQSGAELSAQPVHAVGSQTKGIAKNIFIKGLDKYFC